MGNYLQKAIGSRVPIYQEDNVKHTTSSFRALKCVSSSVDTESMEL